MSAPLTPEQLWAERDRRIAALRDRQLEEIRLSLPLDDPDRHALDTVADDRFAHLAPGYPNTCNPGDFAASTAAGYNPPIAWDDKPARTADVQTGGVL